MRSSTSHRSKTCRRPYNANDRGRGAPSPCNWRWANQQEATADTAARSAALYHRERRTERGTAAPSIPGLEHLSPRAADPTTDALASDSTTAVGGESLWSNTFTGTPHMTPSTGSITRGGRFSVDVFIDCETPAPGERSTPVKIPTNPDRTTYPLEVWLTGSETFEIVDPVVRTLQLDINRGESDRVTFEVQVVSNAMESADAVLGVYFSYRGRGCGCVERVFVVSAATPAPAAGEIRVSSMEIRPTARRLTSVSTSATRIATASIFASG